MQLNSIVWNVKPYYDYKNVPSRCGVKRPTLLVIGSRLGSLIGT